MACFFDLSKAFDRVWHDGLLAKLSHYGVSGNALTWLKSYLCGRRQRVQVNGSMSAFEYIPAGVPQGSVLGPLLFLAYTIDLPMSCRNEKTLCSQFADDTALVTIAENQAECEESLQSSVSAAHNWLTKWHLLVNVGKTKILSFYNNNRPPQHLPTITLGNKTLDTVKTQRHLGVMFQHNLRWTAHIDYTIKKALKKFNILFRLKSSISTAALSRIFTTYILPTLNYACIAVTPLSQSSFDRLERLQRKAGRICLNLPLFTDLNHTAMLHQLNWPTLFSQRKVQHALLAHAIHNKYAPSHISNLAIPHTVRPVYSLRQPRTWHLPATRTDRCRDSPIFTAMNCFNSLPVTTRAITERKSFKSELKSLLLNSTCSCSDHPNPYS